MVVKDMSSSCELVRHHRRTGRFLRRHIGRGNRERLPPQYLSFHSFALRLFVWRQCVPKQARAMYLLLQGAAAGKADGRCDCSVLHVRVSSRKTGRSQHTVHALDAQPLLTPTKKPLRTVAVRQPRSNPRAAATIIPPLAA